MENAARKLGKKTKYSYADYLLWPDDERWEIIDGVPYSMSPAPVPNHQRISMELSRQIANYLVDKSCEIFTSPIDVRFVKEIKENNEDIFDVVQPDIIIVCDKKKIDDKGCIGPPDIVIEILSPSTASRDFLKKRMLYEKNKVKYYWIVSPDEKEIYIHQLQDNSKYGDPDIYKEKDKIKISNFKDLEIDLSHVFKIKS